jgi:hypothetical protein
MSSTKDRPLRIDRDDPGSLPLATLRIRGGNGGDGAGTELLVVSDSASYTCDRPVPAPATSMSIVLEGSEELSREYYRDQWHARLNVREAS